MPRDIGTPLEQFGEHVLLIHFVELFAPWYGVPAQGRDWPMPKATVDGITPINVGMGSPSAVAGMDRLSAVWPRAPQFPGKCGGLRRKNPLDDLAPPIVAIRGKRAFNDYLSPAVPAFQWRRAVSR